VYLSLTDGNIERLAGNNLREAEASFTHHRSQGNYFAASGGRLYLTGDDGTLYELDGMDGRILRSLALDLEATHVQPILSRGLVFLSLKDTLFCVGAPSSSQPITEIPIPAQETRLLYLTDAANGRLLEGGVRIAWLDKHARWIFFDTRIQNGAAVIPENVPQELPLSVEKEGYVFTKFSWPEGTSEHALSLKPLVKEERWVLHNVFFLEDSALLQDASLPELYELARLLKSNPGARVVIEGHTDATGSQAYNLTLSQERAGAVVEFLARQGIGAWRLESVGYGASRPIADNQTSEGRMKNRRTEIRILL
jgi:outer membrane protein OmpA-like peptidoglycan-associated protein